MDPIAPDPKKSLLPPGTKLRKYLAPPSMPQIHGQDVVPLETLVTPAGEIVAQFQPSANELELLKNGAPVTIVLYSAEQMPPISVGVGGVDLRPRVITPSGIM